MTAPLPAAQSAVIRDARRLLREQAGLAEQAPSTGPLADVVATPFGQGYVLGVVDALCQLHGAPFDALALGIWGAVADDVLGRSAEVERDAALDALVGAAPAEPYGFDAGREYGGHEAMGWARGACVPSALVHLARVRP